MIKSNSHPDLDLNTAPVDDELEPLPLHDHEEDDDIEEVRIKVESRRDERYLAFYLCYAADRSDYVIPLHKIAKDFGEGFELDVEQHEFALKLADAAIDNRDELDKQLTPFLKNWRLERLGCCTRLILRLALWELQQPDIIASIVINEAVELAKSFAEKDAYKFVNGLLDEFYKQMAPAEQPDIQE